MEDWDIKSSFFRRFWRQILSFITIIFILFSSNSVAIVNAIDTIQSTWTGNNETQSVAICKDWVNYYPTKEIIDKYIQAGWITWTCEELTNTGAIEESNQTSTWTIQEENSKKQKICKVQPNGKSHTIEVSSKAVETILKDWKSYLWECKNEDKENKNNNKITWEKWCHWIDQYWRKRWWEKQQWRHTDMVAWSEPLELYLVCPEKDNYTKDKKSPWCQNIEKQYKLKDSKNISAPWFTRKLANCRAYWVPYNKPTTVKWLEEYEEELKAKWNITLNADSVFSESQNLIVQLSLDTTPDYIAFSEDWENFWDWINYESSVIDYRLKDNSEWVKTVYFKYKIWSTESDITYDKILLLNKYWSSYTILSNWLEKKQNYEIDKNYKFTLSLTNKWYYNWDNSENPVRLTYKIYDENNKEIELATNYWVLPEEVWYNKTTQTDIIVRMPEQSWKYKVEFSLEHFGYTNFKDAWVTPLVKEIEVIDSEIQSRQIIQNKESLPFGIGNYYVPLNQEEVPNDIVVCEDSTNIYSLTASWTVFSLEYRAPYLTNITTPRIHDIWLDAQDYTSFYEISYDDKIPWLSFDDHFYIYKNSVELSNICSTDSYDFDQRRCEEEFSDMASSSDMDCFTAYTVSSKDWFSGYKDWTFKWENTMNRAEYSKVLVNASQEALIPYREWSISDIQGTDEQWWSDYAQTVVDNNLMELSNTWAFFPLNDITYMDAIKWSLRTFNFDMQNNTCDYTIIKPDNTYLGVALFFGLIDKTSIPNNPYTDSVDRLTVARIMLNAYHQEASLKNASDFCPKSSDDVFETYTKEICASDEKAVLSTTQNLNKDWIELNNWTKVEVLDDSSSIVKVRVIWLDEEWYISNNELAETCTIPTPTDELKEPKNNEVVVASLVGIYAHEKPNATSWYFDFNKDGQANNQDIIPYNTVLTVLETKWNWFKVEFEDNRTAWIFNWFVAIWPDVEIFTPETKVTWTISWDYWVTVDLRANTNTETKENIIWETYEDTKVQILWKDETNNLYYVKIEDTPKDITQEIFDTHYARLYPNFTLEEVQAMENGIAGWVHKDLVKLDWIDYTQNQTLNYPFDYEALSNSWMTVDRLVTQIFFEEFNWDVHDAMDFNLEAWEKVKAVANGTVESVESNTVTILHNDWKISIYAHIIPSEDILNGTLKTVTPEIVLWVVAEDTAKFKAHLHFELKGENGKSLNPAKYFRIYNSQDSHKCMRELVIWEGIYDGEEVKEKCEVGIGGVYYCIDSNIFKDILSFSIYCDSIKDAYNLWWLSGRENFQLNSDLTREEALKWTFKVSWLDYVEWDSSCLDWEHFIDLKSTDWITKYVCAWVKYWFVAKNQYFRPRWDNATISYAEYLRWIFIATWINKCFLKDLNEDVFWGYKYQAIAKYFWLMYDSSPEFLVKRGYAVVFLVDFYDKVLNDNSSLKTFENNMCDSNIKNKEWKTFSDYLFEANYPAESYIISIFDLARAKTIGISPIELRRWTRWWNLYDLKTNLYLNEYIKKDKKDVLDFYWEDIELSNMWNILAWFNMANNSFSSQFIRDVFMGIEIDNAKKLMIIEYNNKKWIDISYLMSIDVVNEFDNYIKKILDNKEYNRLTKCAEEFAKWDEYEDEIWYDVWEFFVYPNYIKAKTVKSKIEIIRDAIIKTNPEYNKRHEIAISNKQYYLDLFLNWESCE